MSGAYPELKQSADKIKKYMAHEESQFLTLLERNYDGIHTAIEKAKAAGAPLSGEVAFFYHDSQGFPIDVTRDLCAQFGVALDEAEYERLMREQRERARAAAKFETEFGTDESLPTGEFVGYANLTVDGAKVLAVREIAAGEPLGDGDEALVHRFVVATDRTPFYAEGGGQPGDSGALSIGRLTLEITDSKALGQHIVTAPDGIAYDRFRELIVEGAVVTLAVDGVRRCAIARAHTATHLLHKALKTVLGGHVQQAGSQLYADSFRFDFSHTEALTAGEVAEVERLVRGWIVGAHPVTTTTMPLADAKALGVTALFDEKYGQTVRVVTVGAPDGAISFDGYPYERCEVVSRELCGGTHVSRSSDIGGFAIVREESVSAGMRRITAVTGDEVWKIVAEETGFARRMRTRYNTAFDEIESHIEHIETELKLTREKLLRAERERIIEKWMEAAQSAHSTVVRGANGDTTDTAASSAAGTPVEIVAMAVEGVGRESLKFLADRISEAYPNAVVLLGENVDGKAAFVCKVPQALVKLGVKAGDIVKAAAQACGGGGGGRPDFAEAGGKDGARVADGIKAGKKAIGG
jgi:alanyl-tRNA synthetase